jgi:hypothetical protein
MSPAVAPRGQTDALHQISEVSFVSACTWAAPIGVVSTMFPKGRRRHLRTDRHSSGVPCSRVSERPSYGGRPSERGSDLRPDHRLADASEQVPPGPEPGGGTPHHGPGGGLSLPVVNNR